MRARVRWRLASVTVAVALICLAPILVGASGHESPGEVEISVEVVPPGDAGMPPPGTNTAWIAGLEEPFDGEGALPVALVASDERKTGRGWQVQLQSETASTGGPVLLRYTHRTETLTGQAVEGASGPQGQRLSVGQPLDAPVPALSARPGTGSGIYRVGFEIEPAPAEEVTRGTFILTIPSAP